MEEHAHTPDSEGPFTPSNLTSFAVKVVIESMKGSRNKRIREAGETAADIPKALARFGSKAIDAIFSSNEEPTEEALAEAAKDLEKHPEEVVAAAGEIMISTVVDVANSTTQLQKDLEGYALIMSYVCEFMQNSRSSIVLLGFFHGDDCISYWHLTGEPKVLVEDDHIEWVGFQVYLKWPESLAQDFVGLNEEIRDNRQQQLSEARYDITKDSNIGEVTLVRRAHVSVRKLDPNDPAKPLFGGKTLFPRLFDYPIPVGAPSALTMFESLPIAKDILNARSKGIADTLAVINDLRNNAHK